MSARTNILRIPLTVKERRLLNRVAKKYLGTATWAREVLLREASSANNGKGKK